MLHDNDDYDYYVYYDYFDYYDYYEYHVYCDYYDSRTTPSTARTASTASTTTTTTAMVPVYARNISAAPAQCKYNTSTRPIVVLVKRSCCTKPAPAQHQRNGQ